jgi:hypothetical protein
MSRIIESGWKLMLAHKINSNPTITSRIIEEILPKNSPITIEFSYQDDGVVTKIQENIELDYFITIDKSNLNWNPDKHDLTLQISFQLETVDVLFGQFGIMPDDAEIGIALSWKSIDSHQTGIVDFNNKIYKSTAAQHFSMIHTFDPGLLRGAVELSVVFYVANPGTVINGRRFENKVGSSLGELFARELILDTVSAEFPWAPIKDPNESLCFVKFSSSDPEIDSFTREHVACYVNFEHPLYIDAANSGAVILNKLLKQIKSELIHLIVLEFIKNMDMSENDFKNFLSLDITTIKRGSVAAAVRFFCDEYELDDVSPSELARKIAKNMD